MIKAIILILLTHQMAIASVDTTLARNIDRVYRQLRINRPHYSKIKNSLKSMKKTNSLSHYKTELDFLKDIRSQSYLTKTDCSIAKKAYNGFHQRFQNQTIRYCHYSKINRLTNVNSFKVDQIKDSILFLLENHPITLNRLLNSKKRNKNYTKLKELLTQVTIDSDKEVNPSLITHYTEDSFVNSKKTYSPKSLKIQLHRKLKEHYRDFKKSLEDESKEKYIIKSNLLLSFYDKNKTNFRSISYKYLLYTGLQLLRRGHKEESLRIFKYSYNLKSNLKDQEEALFYILWNHIKYEKYNLAANEIEKYRVIENFSKHSSKIKYWSAYSLYKEKEDSIAKHLFNLLIKNDPLSYYAIISKFTYPELTNNKISDVEKSLKPIELNKENFNHRFLSNVQEISIWNEIERYGHSDIIIREMDEYKNEDIFSNATLLKDYSQKELKKILSLTLIKHFKYKKDYLSSFKLLNVYLTEDILKLSDIDLNYIFPDKYLDIITKYNSGLDPILVLSLIRQESAFNKSIRSHANARGLMQLLPQTAKTVGRLKRVSDLYKPEINIKYGIKYLKKLLNRFDNNLIFALGAYNAGPHRIKRWMKDTFSQSDPIKLIEEIPYKETRMYVKLIYRNMYFYRLINNEKFDYNNYKKSFLVTQNETEEASTTH